MNMMMMMKTLRQYPSVLLSLRWNRQLGQLAFDFKNDGKENL